MVTIQRFRFTGLWLALLCAVHSPSVSRADLAVTYSAVEAELVLFNQPQQAPFGSVGFKLFLKGSQIRTETTDHRGRSTWQIVDRTRGTAYELNPTDSTYRELGVQGNCDNLAEQMGHWAAYWIRLSGTDTLVMDSPVRATVGDTRVDQCAFHFRGKLLGAPRPVEADLIVSMPVDESAVIGSAGQAELYCESKPTQAQWGRAFQNHLPLSEREAAELAAVTGLPLQIELNTDLGLGQAHLTVRATQIGTGELSDALFTIPAGFTPGK